MAEKTVAESITVEDMKAHIYAANIAKYSELIQKDVPRIIPFLEEGKIVEARLMAKRAQTSLDEIFHWLDQLENLG